MCSVLLFVYVMALLLVVLTPGTGGPDQILAALVDVAVDAGAQRRSAGNTIEIVLNVLLTAPAALLASVVWPEPSWRDWTAWAFLLFGTVEAAQLLLLPARHGSFSDVVANTAGCCLGALVVAAARRGGPQRVDSPPA